MKKQKWVEGSVVRINIGGGNFSYASLDKIPLIFFYDQIDKGDYSIERIVKQKVIFRIAVMEAPVKKGRWEIIGTYPVDPVQREKTLFAHNPVGSDEYNIVTADELKIPSTYEECEFMEPYAVWFPEHVEERLSDHFDGKPNKVMELNKIKPPFNR